MAARFLAMVATCLGHGPAAHSACGLRLTGPAPEPMTLFGQVRMTCARGHGALSHARQMLAPSFATLLLSLWTAAGICRAAARPSDGLGSAARRADPTAGCAVHCNAAFCRLCAQLADLTAQMQSCCMSATPAPLVICDVPWHRHVVGRMAQQRACGTAC